MQAISVLIPIYNSNVEELVASLSMQLAGNSIEWEIILADDGSNLEFAEKNRLLSENNRVRYSFIEQNIGRSAIRNKLIEWANYDWLLFLDDKNMISGDFIQKYVDEITKSGAPQVIVGGKKPAAPSNTHQQHLLRYKYAKSVEHKSQEERSRFPYRSFITGNFLAQKSIMEQFKFEQRIQTYGHEDTLLGLQLMAEKMSIKHIDNPVIVNQWDENCVFLKKSKHGIRNLLFLCKHYGNLNLEEVRLIKVYRKTKAVQYFFSRKFWKRLAFFLETKSCQTGSVFLFNSFKYCYFTYLNK